MKKEIFDKYAHAIAEQFHLGLDEMFVQKFMEDNGCKIAHSTIIHGYKQAKALIDADKDYLHMIEKINQEV